uniref:PD-(D/E)XK nuclease superfamily protein n=1 Tax=Candidatus Kentrum sp. DK TaxID=2126562 RepID=A0A450T5K0_9GAMM|nr:MAG: PD-(D/E)XK nuclease superfamily protein [Candidatus Kentron sp. DK]VFJ62009.1 MAG: PD-(D/E)XK nuclease superfamily protein [Candidatus Kentron sp. DK]
MKFPYGIADFQALITEGYFYADRTLHIAALEEAGKHLLFLRPRRFGKSLVLSMLENYYDVAKSDAFQRLFGHLAIGQTPTPRHNQYFVMWWDFSMVESHGGPDAIARALHDHINACVRSFISRYRTRLPQSIALNPDNGLVSFQSAVDAVAQTPYKLFLVIDEYDNFANEVMASQMRGQDRYAALVHGEGILKTVFKAIKGLSAGHGLDRVFITGVSPVVMSDISSGYNVVKDISLRREYQDLCGFYESEVAGALTEIRTECELTENDAAEALSMMRTFYNGYRFGYGSGNNHQPLLYNPTLALYFLDEYRRDCAYPQKILDSNLAMDRNRIEYIARLPHGNELISKSLDPADPPRIGQLADRFGVEDMLKATKDQPFLASLMYYLGILTITDRDAMGRLILGIPNLVIRSLYVERIRDATLPEYEDREDSRHAAEHFYTCGDIEPLCDFIESRYWKVFDNRDYRWANELTVKTAFLVVLFSDTFYIMDSETAIDKGYADLSMIVRPDMRQFALLDHLIEFKYLSLSDVKLTAEDLRALDRAAIRALPQVREKLDSALAQLSRYRVALAAAYGEKLRLHTHAVVGIGFERVVWE